MNIPEESLKKLKCARCQLYLSVGPVTNNSSGKFLCGRCSNGGTQIKIYEALAENFVFPCRYQSLGCRETMKWGAVSTHERSCSKKLYLCAAVPIGTCLWRGAVKDIAEHFKQNHAEDVTDQNLIEIKLHDNLEGCKLIEIGRSHYIFHAYFNREQRLLKLNLVQLSSIKTQQYQVTLHSHDFSKRISLAADSIETYNSMDHNSIQDKNIVDLSVLKFLTSDKPSIFCEITLLQTEKKKRINTELFKLLECPVCNECLSSPIYQCQSGHSLCSHCVTKLKDCPLCHKELTETRNYVLEDLVNQVSQQCKNKDFGCTYNGSPEDIRNHEGACCFYKCPLATSQKCTWGGDFDGLIEHCKNDHSYLQSENYGLLCSLTVDKQGVFRLIYADGMFFKVCRRYDNEELCVAIQFVGPNDKAANYSYEFILVGTDDGETNLCVRDACHTLTDDESAFDKSLKIPYSMLASFTKNNKLRCNIKVIKKQETLTL